jgi:predicted metal-dependent enzyme (double-stranded beta helix superfamily)
MTIARERARAIDAALGRIRELEHDLGVTRAGVEAISKVLLELAAGEELFPPASFPLADPGPAQRPRFYRLAEDPDHRFALYANASRGGVDSPVHNHTTWAVVVGIRGEELNRFYRRNDDGVEQTGERSVGRGTAVAMLPDDLHSIHIHGDEPVLNLHMYGLGLEQLHERRFFDPRERRWRPFPPLGEIHEPVS